MKRYPLIFFIIVIAVMLLIDIYAFRGLKVILQTLPEWLDLVVSISFWGITLIIISAVFSGFFFHRTHHSPGYSRFVSATFALVLLSLLPKLFFIIFFAAGDVTQFLGEMTDVEDSQLYYRIGLIITFTGLFFGVALFLYLLYGVLFLKHNFKVRHVELTIPHLPTSFDGFKVVQLSDIHIGSFHGNHKPIQNAFNKVNSLEPDVLVFTGDLVNNFAAELNGWESFFASLQANYAKYSVLGNHDYGDYHHWSSMDEKYKNLERLIKFQENVGFKVLLNEYETIDIAGEKIAVIGVENWGKPPFRQYGDLAKATEKLQVPFKILLSHDPSHWDAEVIKTTDIDLTLSGHTHGAQFSVRLGKRKWSPVQYKYPRWHGLYQEGNQYLYVNNGLGYLGFYGRIGMRPEITCFTLRKENS